MCSEVIKEAKIKKVVYAAKNQSKSHNKDYLQINNKEIINNCEQIIKNKFTELRNK